MKDFVAIDLFSGCGGLSEGFKQAGFKIALACDMDVNAAKTHTRNHSGTVFINGDVRSLKPEIILNIVGLNKGKIDAVLGGTPCQGFTTAGRRNPSDPRNRLTFNFLRIAGSLKPDFIVMENVSGILTISRGRVKRKIIKMLERMGYATTIGVLNAADYGVPQYRRRAFFIASKISKPSLPPRPVKEGEFITVWEAISDLPSLKPGESTSEYISSPHTQYQKIMRKGSHVLYNHEAPLHRNLTLKRFSFIPKGGNVMDIPDKIRPSPYLARYRRLDPNELSPTITGHAQSELIHPYSDRCLTVREIARIQSFSDNFVIEGPRSLPHSAPELCQYEQIGMAVPPLLARAIASHIVLDL